MRKNFVINGAMRLANRVSKRYVRFQTHARNAILKHDPNKNENFISYICGIIWWMIGLGLVIEIAE